MLELVWRAAKPANRPEDGCLLTRVTGVDQCQPVVALDQEGVCLSHRDEFSDGVSGIVCKLWAKI